jgi:biopolymer transport protein TolR
VNAANRRVPAADQAREIAAQPCQRSVEREPPTPPGVGPREPGGLLSISLPTGRSRSQVADLNLVPFIDLFSALVAFLMLSAVWTQLTAIETDQSRGEPSALPPSVVTLALTVDGAQVVPPAGATSTFPRRDELLDWNAIRGALRIAGAEALTLRVQDGVAYADFVAGMETARAAGYPNPALGGG